MFCALAACTPATWIDIVPLSLKKISPEQALIVRYTPDRCFWWIDEQQRLCIAMTAQRTPLVGENGRLSLAASMVLAEAPAGPGRDYLADRDTLRMIVRVIPKHWRWASLAGIVGIRCAGNDHLHGRFRVVAKFQNFHIAMGWYGQQRDLIVGEFEARHDPAAGKAILALSEVDGMERSPSSDAARPAARRAPPASDIIPLRDGPPDDHSEP